MNKVWIYRKQSPIGHPANAKFDGSWFSLDVFIVYFYYLELLQQISNLLLQSKRLQKKTGSNKYVNILKKQRYYLFWMFSLGILWGIVNQIPKKISESIPSEKEVVIMMLQDHHILSCNNYFCTIVVDINCVILWLVV